VTSEIDLTGSGPLRRVVEGAQADPLLAEQRRLIGQRVMAGASGRETFTAMTDLVDDLILGRYHDAIHDDGEALADAGLHQCCVVALGGGTGGGPRCGSTTKQRTASRSSMSLPTTVGACCT
jgi:hypothetical protein